MFRPLKKSRIAKIYYPDMSEKNALKLLHAELQENEALARALAAQGYDPAQNKQYFSASQIKVIVRFLGNPFEEEVFR